MIGVNETVRHRIRQIMRERGTTQTQLAQITKIAAPNISRLLKEDGSGQVPENWQRILDALGLELTVKEKGK